MQMRGGLRDAPLVYGCVPEIRAAFSFIEKTLAFNYNAAMTKTSLPADLQGAHFHLVGIKGTGMTAFAEILCRAGAVVSGSDVAERFYTDAVLEAAGIAVLPFSEANITDRVQFVVYSSAYHPDTNPDLRAAVCARLPLMLYTEALGAYSALFYSAGICGVHGKTSTTGLAGTILKELPLPAQALAGSVINSFSEEGSCIYTAPSFHAGTRGYFVAETCEYQRHFLSFHPHQIVLTSVESDHQDFFPTYNDIQAAFIDYICLLPTGGALIYCADDAGAAETALRAAEKRADIRLIPYGEQADGEYRLTFGTVEGGENRFSLALLGALSLRVPGKHSVRNAAAAIALTCELLRIDGKEPKDFAADIQRGLTAFSGGRRRSEIVGRTVNAHGVPVVIMDDYAHHPTAIKTTLAGYRAFYKGWKIIADFMSHTYSRTAALLDGFASAFTDADTLILHKIYASAREDPDAAHVSGRDLFERAKAYQSRVFYFDEVADAKECALAELNAVDSSAKGILFVTMGAGDNWTLGRAALDALRNAMPRCQRSVL